SRRSLSASSCVICPRRTMNDTRSRALSTAKPAIPAAALMTSFIAMATRLPASRLISCARSVSSAIASRASTARCPGPRFIGTAGAEFTRVLAGPLCTMVLGDLGADVIKVERPTSGDDTRAWGPPFDERGESAYYLSINRNKLSIAADLGRAVDRALVVQLIERADVVVE